MNGNGRREKLKQNETEIVCAGHERDKERSIKSSPCLCVLFFLHIFISDLKQRKRNASTKQIVI